MCLAFIVRNVLPDIPVLLLFNRDEDYERVSLPVHFWSESPNVLGGFDVLTNGTWAGVNRDGRFGMITFVREPRLLFTPDKRRGQILREFLAGSESVEDAVQRLATEHDAYLGYNIILGEPGTVLHYNNRSRQTNAIGAGIFGVSNADFETPWFKVKRGKAAIADAISSAALLGLSTDRLFEILEDRTIAADREVQETGLAFEREKGKSPMFVTLPNYGTRSSSVVRLHASGKIDFHERSYAVDGRRRLEVAISTEKGW